MIKFGTSAGKEIIAKNLIVAMSLLLLLKLLKTLLKKGIKSSVIIGYNMRFISEGFEKMAAEIFAGNGVKSTAI
jgi:phosphomannomutase